MEILNNKTKTLKETKEEIIAKWDKLGFLDGLKGHVKENIASLYECCKSVRLNEKTGEMECCKSDDEKSSDKK